MPTNRTSKRTVPVLSQPQCQIPSIQINDGQALQDSCTDSLSGTSSPRAFDQFQEIHDHSRSRSQSVQSSLCDGFSLGQQPMQPSPWHSPSDNDQGLQYGSLSPALSTSASIYTSPQNLPYRQLEDMTLASNNASFSSQPWQMLPHSGLGLSYAQSGDTSPSVDTETFSFIDYDCEGCQSKADRVTQLENKIQVLAQTMRVQHKFIRSQQQIIVGLQQSTSLAPQKDMRKRGLESSESGTDTVAGSSEHTTDMAASPSKRGKFPPQQRKQTAETRQRGACVRCRKHKQRCEPGEDRDGPCKSCQDPNLSLIRIPCIRTHIVDLSIFRCGTGQHDTWTRRDDVENVQDLSTYTSENRRHLVLSHGFGPKLNVTVRSYCPVRDDVLDYTWRDGLGIDRQKTMPNFALADIEDLISNVESYVRTNQDAYIRHFVRQEDVLTYEAFRIAKKLIQTGKSSLLSETLKLWTAARLIEKPWQICGDDKLGLEADQHWWWVPVTPIMDTQLDKIVIRYLTPLRKHVLHALQTKIEKGCRDNFLEIFVAIIILLNTLEEATRHDHEFARFFGHECSARRRRFEDYKLVESYFHSALTLLTHVKVAFDGRLPYLDADTDVSKLMSACHVGDEQEFMIAVDRYVNEQKSKTHFAKIRERHQYEEPQYWVHQLFLKEWNGLPTNIQEKQ